MLSNTTVFLSNASAADSQVKQQIEHDVANFATEGFKRCTRVEATGSVAVVIQLCNNFFLFLFSLTCFGKQCQAQAKVAPSFHSG